MSHPSFIKSAYDSAGGTVQMRLEIEATNMRRPGVLTGALVGLLLTAPLIVVSALGNQLAGLPFFPFDLFPFIRDLTPGAVLTFMIDSMVSVIRALNLGRVDTAAKTAEQGMAMLMLIGVGIVAGGLFFLVMRGLRARSALAAGLIFGLIVGALMILISAGFGLSTSAGAAASTLWTILLFALWGLAFGWAYDRLTTPGAALLNATQL